MCSGRRVARLRHTHAHTLHSHTCAFTHTCYHVITRSRCTFALAHTRTHWYSRCRLTQRSTWGVTVEREGHWEMFLATCRASILRAASTSSSWAAHMGVWGEGLMEFRGKGKGVAAQGWESKGKTYRELSTHTACCLCFTHHQFISHRTLKNRSYRWEKNGKMNMQDDTMRKHTKTHTSHIWATDGLLKERPIKVYQERSCVVFQHTCSFWANAVGLVSARSGSRYCRGSSHSDSLSNRGMARAGAGASVGPWLGDYKGTRRSRQRAGRRVGGQHGKASVECLFERQHWVLNHWIQAGNLWQTGDLSSDVVLMRIMTDAHGSCWRLGLE